MADPNRLALTDATRELTQLTGQRVGYTRLYKSVLEGVVAAERDGARWFIRRADLPAVATALGLAPTAPAGEPSISRRNTSATVAA